MDYIYIFILDLLVIGLGVLGLKFPISAFIGFLISLGILWDMLMTNSLGDVALTTLTAISIASSLLCGIIGWGND